MDQPKEQELIPQPEQNEPVTEKTAEAPAKRRFRLPTVTVDFSQPKHRKNFLFAAFGIIVAATAFLVANIQVYHYTESSEFCGETCHVMDPQYERYNQSAHAKVECVACHIGPGVEPFVKSKVDGLKQVYAVLTNSYRRPISGPVHNLRPARETCEQCHNPGSFKDNVIKTIVHFDNDEQNTRVQSTLILKMGGVKETTGHSQGIHWHTTSKVYYIPADENRQTILWVGVEQPDGSMKEYFARDAVSMAQTSFVEDAFENDEVRLMDCIDCHNRAAHFIPSPQQAVDVAIRDGLIDRDIPHIRAKGVETLTAHYDSVIEANEAIDGLVEFYQLTAPAFISNDSPLVDAISELKDIYSQTNFPAMELDWQTSPNNVRHTPFLGCFRCHDDKHVAVDNSGQEAETISVKCNLCHTVPIVGRGNDLLVEAPVIAGEIPESHTDFRWTIEHRDTMEEEKQDCYQCHGQAFCSNDACHNLSHPEDMLFTHADEYRLQGEQTCYTCHQDILCSRCHPGGIIDNP